jgi:hypothetical protein
MLGGQAAVEVWGGRRTGNLPRAQREREGSAMTHLLPD